MEKIINVGFIGNPNCGKTTLFNAYTGANLKVANWPGVTVEKKEGFTTYEDQKFRLIDLPGIYSLTSYTMEETVSRECIMSDEVDVIVDVIDASSLERNLYLALQLIELGKPVVLALNMMDIVESRGMELTCTASRKCLEFQQSLYQHEKRQDFPFYCMPFPITVNMPARDLLFIITKECILNTGIIITQNMPWSIPTL